MPSHYSASQVFFDGVDAKRWRAIQKSDGAFRREFSGSSRGAGNMLDNLLCENMISAGADVFSGRPFQRQPVEGLLC